jgi:hypothetical protein
MVGAVAKCGLVDNVLTWADFKQSKELKKNDGAKRQRITGIPKLDDANDAGGKSSEKCTLILTEGDTAKALAVSFWCIQLVSSHLLEQTSLCEVLQLSTTAFYSADLSKFKMSM